MRTNCVMGIIFPNVHDDLLYEMTAQRSMGSVPFGGRYRLIDFSLSNLVNAGISRVGVIVKSNYQSLMDHLSSGKPWDLDRKKGGLVVLPPYGNSEARVYTGHIDALQGAMNFLKSSTEQYVVMCDANVVSNFDMEAMINSHIETGADVTIAYKRGKLPKNHRDIMSFQFDENSRVTEILLSNKIEKDCDFSLDITIIERNMLIHLIEEASDRNQTNMVRDIFQPNVKNLKIYGWEVKDFAAVMDSTESYVNTTEVLLKDSNARSQLFTQQRPVLTKTRDDMPTKYGLSCDVSDSIIADGCIIEGTVKSSVLFRGVRVAEGAVVENCIVMQDSVIGKNAHIKHVTTDKNVIINEGTSMSGAPSYPVFIKKGTNV